MRSQVGKFSFYFQFLELFFSLALSFWKSNARRVFAVNEGDHVRRIKKDIRSNMAPTALGSFFFHWWVNWLYWLYALTNIAWRHPDVTTFREHYIIFKIEMCECVVWEI